MTDMNPTVAATRRPTSRPRRVVLGIVSLVAATLVPLACSEVTDVELLEINGTGAIRGQAFLDLDGNGVASTGDTPIADVDVFLVTGSRETVVLEATSDGQGIFNFPDVPLGSYRLTLDPAEIADSLEVLAAGAPVTIGLGDTTLVTLGVTYPVRTIEQLLAEPVGHRFFTSGIALNSRVNFDPTGQVHFAGDSLYLRALNVARSSIATGDSIRLLGRLVLDNGRRVLDAVTPTRLVPAAAIPVARDATAAEAASAGGGALDAALVRIRALEITDTSTNAEGDFRFWGVRGADSVEILFPSWLVPTVNTAVIKPDSVIRVQQVLGLLTPFDDGSGTLRWRVRPRTPTDVTLETKLADVAVTVALTPTGVSLGDTVEVTVVAGNNGPATATALEVRDTIPAALSYVSASSTAGSYDPGTGIWSIGSIAAGAADTLRVRLEVIDGTAASIPIVAESLGLTFEVDGVSANNGQLRTLVIS
jgi:uncharacterized repeat protein (TIGR01451 family)